MPRHAIADGAKRQNGSAEAGADKAFHGFDAFDLHGDLGGEAEGLKVAIDEVLHLGFLFIGDEAELAQVVGQEDGFARHGVVVIEDDDELFGAQRNDAHALFVAGRHDDGEIDLMAFDGGEEELGGAGDDDEFDFGEAAVVGAEDAGEAVGEGGGADAEAHGAALEGAHFADGHFGVGEVAEDAVGILQEDGAGLADEDAFADAEEEGAPEFGFELLDVLADGGLGDVELAGGAGESTAGGGGLEDAELMEVHGDWRSIG